MTGIVPSGQGRQLTARGNVMAFKAVAAQTGGDFSLMERTVPPGARTPPPHRHVNCSEAFFVLDGTITFWLVVLHAPAMDAYFAELDALWAGPEPPSREAERELMSRYGMEPA
jgi:hypothetical protein